MSDFSLTLVLQIKSSKIINDMVKVSIKSEKITPFGGIFHVRELFSVTSAPLSTKCWISDVRHTAISTARLSVRCRASTSAAATSRTKYIPATSSAATKTAPVPSTSAQVLHAPRR